MKNKLIFLLLLCFFLDINAFAKDNRTLLKLPYATREDMLRSMRKYIGTMENILKALSKKDFVKVEELASYWLLGEQGKINLALKGNDQFIAMAVEFHTTGAVEIIKAARKKNLEATLMSLSSFFGRCNACHANFRLTEWPSTDYPPAAPKVIKIPSDYNEHEWIRREYKK